MSVGEHIIFFKVCDDEGNWSEEDSRELTIQSQGQTGTVEGRVCEAGTETVIAGAQVNIGQISDTTGADGLFSLEGVELGEGTINARSPGFEPYEAAISVVQGSNIHHIYMTPSTQTTNLRGTVTDYADLPVAGARVEIALETTYTDASGRYEFVGLPRGFHYLKVSEVECYDEYNFEIELNATDMTHNVRLSLSALPAPSGFTASADGFLLNSLSWNPVECAVRYNVYVSSNAGGSSQLLDQVSPPDTGYQHSLNSNCSDLWYSVAPVGLDGREAEATQWVQVSPIRTLQVNSDTTVSGELCFDESLVINYPAVLTVLAGSRLRFAEGCGVEVHGGLLAQGNASLGIVFKGFGETGAWAHVAFHDTSDAQSCKLSYVTIQGGMETHGGAIYCDGASPTIEYCTIRENTAAQGGGGITCLNYSSPTIEGNTISGNSAIVGGAICCHESSPSIQDNTITGNSAGNDGGGIFYYKSSPSIQNNTITGNSAGHGGGICCFSDSLATITGNSIRDNVATFGGGIACEDYSSPTIESNTITGNSAGNDGGGIYCYCSSPSILNNTITGNLGSQGGAVLCWKSSPSIQNNTITDSETWNHGGGIACEDYSSPTIEGNTITGNSADYGGGTYCDAYCAPTIDSNTISGNTATVHGGGICYSRSWPTIRGNTISSNQADSCGGGIYCYEDAPGNSPIIFNNVITGNLAIVYGGAISTYNSEPRINNNTIAGNTGQAAAGGIYSVNWPEPAIFDCILWDNVGDDLYGCSDVTYCCVEDGDSGTGNISDNPLFTTGPYGSYYLARTSPCVNAGSQSAENAGLSQRTTQIDNTPDTGTVDMGYHYPIPTER